MTRTRSVYRIAHRQQAGAALVVGLLMLLVLTVLAVSGVNTSSLNLMMAGNTQYSQNAFQAAEAGIERAIAANEFNPDPNLPPERQENVGVGDGDDEYTAISTTQLSGWAQPALPGASLDSFSTYHFEIASTGTSARGAVARNLQAIAVIAPADAVVLPVPNIPAPGGGGAATKELR